MCLLESSPFKRTDMQTMHMLEIFKLNRYLSVLYDIQENVSMFTGTTCLKRFIQNNVSMFSWVLLREVCIICFLGLKILDYIKVFFMFISCLYNFYIFFFFVLLIIAELIYFIYYSFYPHFFCIQYIRFCIIAIFIKCVLYSFW